jgi:ATP-binding cassette subfamily B protein
MLKRFVEYYKPHKKMLFLDMAASLVVSIIAMLYPIITRYMLKTLIPDQKYKMIILFGCLLLGIYVVRTLLRFFIQYYGHVIGVKMQASMRSDMFRKLETLPYTYYDNTEVGKIMSRMTNDLQDVAELAHHGPENFFICGITIIGSFIYLCTIEYRLTLIVFACVPFLILVAVLLRKKMMIAFKNSRKSIAEVNARLESSLTGIRVTKAFTNSEKEQQKFEEGNNQFVLSRSDAYHAMAEFQASTSFITDIFNVIILIAGGLFLYAGEIDLADYTTFLTSISLFISPVMTIIQFMEQFQDGVTGFSRFIEIMDEPSEQNKPGSKPIDKAIGHIEFKNVNFSYNNNNAILKDISLDIMPGTVLALVGPSGGGKTTICHLIPRFYEVSTGQILLDGMNTSDITLESLRKQIGIVQQDVFLFHGTIKDNIRYGNLDATEEEIILAAKRANIYDDVMKFEHGFDTEIGERGVKLSGGQKQRLSIARVFLKNPSILILDEATSALDNTTEIMIQKSLDELCKGRTTLVVAHRLSTIKNATEIVVIDDGCIEEKGSHEELMKQDGIYKKLYTEQFRRDEKDIYINDSYFTKGE